MSDYIKREDMKKVMCTVCCYRGICFRDLKCPLGEMIDAIPAADVREVVHCKDCKHRPIELPVEGFYGTVYTTLEDEPLCPWLEYNGNSWVCGEQPDDDFFCDNGERGGDEP